MELDEETDNHALSIVSDNPVAKNSHVIRKDGGNIVRIIPLVNNQSNKHPWGLNSPATTFPPHTQYY